MGLRVWHSVRPALGRGSRAVPGAGGNRARDHPGAEQPILRPQRSVSTPTCRSGNHMGSPQDANPGVLSTQIARFRKLRHLGARGRPDDKRTLVSHTLDDGRSSRVRCRPWSSLRKRLSRTHSARIPRSPFPARQGAGYDASMLAPTRCQRRPGSAASATAPAASPGLRARTRRRSKRWKTRCTKRRRCAVSTAA